MKDKILRFFIKLIVDVIFRSMVVFFLWNWLIPDLFLCGCELSFLQAFGMVAMFKYLSYWNE